MWEVTNRGILRATLDGGAAVTLDCYHPTATTSETRVAWFFSGVAAGQHQVAIDFDTDNAYRLSPER